MLVGGVVANLLNTKTNRYHPIVFKEAPQSGHGYGDQLVRFRSVGHHTKGCATRNEALAECCSIARNRHMKRFLKSDFVWDGEGVPAMVVFFSQADGQLEPVLY